MLISFSFENVRSFAKRGTLLMAAHSAHKNIPGALIAPPSELPDVDNLLSVAAIYGPNAAGKSNVLKAFEDLRQAVLWSQTRWEPSLGTNATPHALHKDKLSTLEVEFFSENTRYRYGFSMNPSYIESEWLYSYPKKRERLLFRRETSAEGVSRIKFGATFSGDDRDHQSTQRRVRSNSLFLSAASQDNQKECSSIYKWIWEIDSQSVPIDKDDIGFTNRLCSIDSPYKDRILSLIRSADSNLRQIVVRKNGERVEVNEEWAKTLPEETIQFLRENRDYTAEFVFGNEDEQFNLNFSQQSDGTKKLYGLAASIIGALSNGKVIFIDEIESSLHPHVSSQIISLFQNKSTNPNGAQLIFTTHDTNLLSSDILRRDQIWFVEKEHSQSQLYSLLDFSPRKDENLEVGYLRGRYGAVPTLGLGSDFFQTQEAER